MIRTEAIYGTLRRWGVKENWLEKKIERSYEETEITIRNKEGYTESFTTRKGMRQGWIHSYLIYIGIGKLENRGIGGIKIGELRVWSLAYADDIMLVARK